MQKLKLQDLHRKTIEEYKAANKTPILVILDNIRSMHNVGSIFRTADAFLLEGIIICGYTPCPPHREINKTALGATESVDWLYNASAEEAITNIKQKGYHIIGLEQTDSSIPLNTFAPPDAPIALIVGNEVEGVSTPILHLCDTVLEIPQLGMKHSLNVSVAAGIALWSLIEKRLP